MTPRECRTTGVVLVALQLTLTAALGLPAAPVVLGGQAEAPSWGLAVAGAARGGS